jgi:hypothetical protein
MEVAVMAPTSNLQVTGLREVEPSDRELRAIEREWPVIAAGLAEVDAEIATASADVVDLASRRAAVDASGAGVERAA